MKKITLMIKALTSELKSAQTMKILTTRVLKAGGEGRKEKKLTPGIWSRSVESAELSMSAARSSPQGRSCVK